MSDFNLLHSSQWVSCSMNYAYSCIPFVPNYYYYYYYYYYLSSWSNFNLLHSCQWITFATELCQLLYSFSAKLLLLLFSPCGFSTSELADDLSLVCEWHDSKSPRVSRTLLAAYNNAVVWMVSTRPPTSKSTSPFNNTGQQFFLLFECCLDFYKWFRVFLHCSIRKWHPFLSIR